MNYKDRLLKLRRINAQRGKEDGVTRSGIIPECDFPGVDGVPGVTAYDDRGPGDVVISGPLVSGVGPGRKFESRLSAITWAAEKYGSTNVSLIEAGEYRWAVLVKNLRKFVS